MAHGLIALGASAEDAIDLTNRAAEKGLTKITLKAVAPDQRSMKGYLRKKGGRLGNKGWDRRFFSLSNGKLSYFQHEKDTKPLGIIPMRDMIDVRPTIATKPDAKHANRFELETHQRTWYFSADTTKELTGWMLTLKAMIMTYSASPEDSAIGGRMANPDKGGWIKMRGNDFRQAWQRRYYAVKCGTFCYYHSYEEFVEDDPLGTLDCKLMTVKVGASGAKRTKHQFQLVQFQRTYELQAETKESMQDVIKAIQDNILWALNHMDSGVKQGISTKMTPEDVQKALWENEANRSCVDCGTANPDWASLNLGVVFCLKCSGVHRNLGVHISKVRSATLDEWKQITADMMVALGNSRFNAIWESTDVSAVKPTTNSEDDKRTAFIRQKYVDRAFMTGPPAATAAELDEMLLENVKTSCLEKTVALITHGASKDLVHPVNGRSLCFIAHVAKQRHQVELLHNSGYVLTADEERKVEAGEDVDAAIMQHQGWLERKTDSGWQRCWFAYDLGVLNYYSSDEGDAEPLNHVAIENVTCIGPGNAEDFDAFSLDCCFAIDAKAMSLHLAAASSSARNEWMDVIQSNVAALPVHESFDFDECTITGYIDYNLNFSGDADDVGEKAFFAVKGKQLLYFKSDEELTPEGSIDLGIIYTIARGPPIAKQDGDGAEAPVLQDAPERCFHMTSAEGTLVFLLETPSAAKEWLLVLCNTRPFGAALDTHATLVPAVVEQCLSFIEVNSIFAPGVYRQSGSKVTIDALRRKFNRDVEVSDISPDRYSAHDVAGLLKQFFRELPDPLLTEANFRGFLDATLVSDHYGMLYAFLAVLEKLPQSNHATLKRLCTHLSLIADHETTNKMGLKQLAIVFGPTLMDISNPDTAVVDDEMTNLPKKYKVVETLIHYYEWFFNLEGKTTVEKNLKEGYKRLEAAQQSSQTAASSTICEVFYEDTDTVHSIALTAEMTGNQAVEVVVKKGKYAASKEWSIMESLLEGKLVRPIEDAEKVLTIINLWDGPGVLRLQHNPLKQLLAEAAGKVMAGYLYLRIKKRWRKVYVTCNATSNEDVPALCYYKDEKNTTEMGRVCIL